MPGDARSEAARSEARPEEDARSGLQCSLLGSETWMYVLDYAGVHRAYIPDRGYNRLVR